MAEKETDGGLLRAILQPRRYTQERVMERRAQLQRAEAMYNIAKTDPIYAKMNEKVLKEQGFELTEGEKATALLTSIAQGLIEEINLASRPLPPPAEVVPLTNREGEVGYYKYKPTTKRLAEQTAAQTKGALSPEVAEARVEYDKILNPFEALKRDYFKKLPEDQQVSLVQQTLLPSLDQMTVGWIMQQPDSDQIIESIVRERTEPGPPKQRTVPVETKDGLALQVQEWDGKQWSPAKKAALRPLAGKELTLQQIVLNLSRLQTIRQKLGLAQQNPNMAPYLGVEGLDVTTIEGAIEQLQALLQAKMGGQPVVTEDTTEDPNPLNLNIGK
jgi:hypothetical protein